MHRTTRRSDREKGSKSPEDVRSVTLEPPFAATLA